MKVCILGAVNLKHMSPIKKYIDIFNRNNIKFDIIYFDKYGIEENINGISDENKIYKYTSVFKQRESKLSKLLKFLKFRKLAKNLIYSENYDFIIVWRTETAILFRRMLKKIKGKYIYNIRDYFFDDYPIFKKIQKKLISNSLVTTISSEGFKSFLPKQDYLIFHSINKEEKEVSKLTKIDLPIKLSFIGNIRFFNINKKIISSLKNDNRYLMQYFGTNSDVLKQYAVENGVKNIEFIDSFEISETEKLVEQSTFINNLYGVKEKALNTATSIRYFHSILYKRPIIVFDNTHMAELVRKNNLGIIIDVNEIDNLGNILFEKAKKIDWSEYNCNTKNHKIKLYEKINQFENIIIAKLKGDNL